MLSFTFLYASFWRRAAAFIVDSALLGLFSIFILQPFLEFLGLREVSETVRNLPFSVVVLRTYGMWLLITIVMSWLYFALQESSTKQATFGKRLFGVQVYTSDECRITFGMATGRFFAKILSVAIGGIGFFMALFDDRHRTLHDIIVDTQVLQCRPDVLSFGARAIS